MATFCQVLNPGDPGAWGWSRLSLSCPRPRLLTGAALLQLLHCHRLSWRWWVLHTAQERLHKARTVGWTDAYVVPWLVLEPLLACSVQAHKDRRPAGGGKAGSYRGWEAECGRSRVPGSGEGGAGMGGSCLPHVDLVLCRFSTERTVAWNIFRLCTWIRPGGGSANETESEPGSWPWLRGDPGESRVHRGRGRSGPHLAVAGGPQSGYSAGTSDASSSVWG